MRQQSTATYYKMINLNESHFREDLRIFLDLGQVREIAELYVNGCSLGSRWCSPYRFDITEAARAGDNYL